MLLALRPRLPVATALVLVCIAGPVFRALTDGAVAKVGGDALYAVAVHLLVLLIRPATRPGTAAALTAGICWLVEFAQLTPFPAWASQRSIVARLVLGSTFQAADLAYYLIGVLLIWSLDAAVRRHPRPV